MSKIVKIAGRITGGLFEWILILLIFLAFAIRTSPVQTFLARQATKYLSKELKTTIRIDKVSILFFHKVALDGVFVLDQQKDTLASVNTVFVTLKSFSQTKKLVALDEVNLEGGIVKISREKENGAYNYGFIQDYFDSGKSTKKKDPMSVTLDHIRLTKLKVHYDDYRKEYSDFGMDFDHLHFRDVYLFAGEFATTGGVISALIKQLSFKEESGFELDKFATYVNVSSKGLKLKALHITTPNSQIYMPKMNLLMDEMADLQSFEDSVTFDVKINESNVSLKDISYFGTALEGMDQQVILEAEISNKVKNLKVANMKMRTGNKTRIEGTINLPDFREFNQAFFQEKLTYVYVDLKDLQSIKMPKNMKDQYLSLGEIVNRLGYFKAIDLKVDGFYSQFVVESDKISTALGTVRLDHGIMFSENQKNKSFVFEESQDSDYDVKIDSFQLGKFLDQKTLGSVYGKFYLNGEVFGNGNINFNKINGELNRVDFMNYPYRNIKVKDASFVKNVFQGEVTIDDENLQLTYNGALDVNKQQHFDFNVDIQEAQLNHLKLINSDTLITLNASFSADLRGTNINNYSGNIGLNSLLYQSGRKAFTVPQMSIRIDRSVEKDILSLQSRILNADVVGKIDFNTIASDFNNQFSVIFPALFTYKKPGKSTIQNHFSYNIKVQEINDLLFVFVPDLKVSPGTTIQGSYDGYTNDFSMNLSSPSLRYDKFSATNIVVVQNFNDSAVNANYQLGTFSLNDSLTISQVSFVTNGSKGNLYSELKWNPGTTNESAFAWNTQVKGLSSYNFELHPSYFTINEHRWDIAREARISFTPKDIHIDSFLLSHDNQYISLDGALSIDESENLKIKVKDFELEDFSALIGVSAGLKGEVNAEVTMSNPFDNLGFNGTAKVSGLYVNNQEVGDVNINGNWDKAKESIALKGDLYYMKNKTFNFDGNYYLNRSENNIDFYLDFDRTNIQFASAFLDPKVISNVKGLLEGKLHITGKPAEPVLEGAVDLLGGNAKIQMFGVNFGLTGRINITRDMIAINHMPIIDEEGNSAAVNGTILHNNFKDWNLDLFIDIDEDRADDFLVLNTVYEEGSIYYGKAYVTGRVNIEGYTDNLDITVDLKTERNTQINFPMFGVSEIEDELSFSWKQADTIDNTPKIDFTGVNLDLNFTVTPDAEIKLIFNDQTGDEITAHGSGKLGIRLDRMSDLSMDGTFTIADGKYNFVLPGLRKQFLIEKGGTITWNGGGAENARLDMTTAYIAYANVNEIVPELESQRSSSSTQLVYCKLFLKGTLSNPEIEFRIEAPKASESARAAIAGINSNPDELNKQFFSLLLANKFQPATGISQGVGSNAALDALTGQINGLLGELSKDVRVNVGLQRDELSGQNSQTIGFTTNAFNNKLIITGNFGVENNAGGSNQSTLIGDLNLEYILDENGNFRVSIFNESNDYTVIQDKNLGPFTQGVGLQYRESFQTYRDFRLWQIALDLFRKKDKKHIKFTKKRKQTPVPNGNAPKEEVTEPEKDAIKPEEETN